jgi:Rrf2 family protein
MKISRSTGYALVAVGYVADNCQDGPVLAARVSKEYGIPLEYLLKIMQQLVRANVLKSKRGPRGGFTLARDPKDISMLQIIEAVNGPLMGHLHLSEQTHSADFSLKMESACKEAAKKAIEIYDKAKISDMI